MCDTVTEGKPEKSGRMPSREGTCTKEFGFYQEGNWKPPKGVKQMCDIKLYIKRVIFWQ